MCGIAGIINPKGMEMTSELLKALKLIQHRGPDATGIAVYGNNDDVLLRVSISTITLEPILRETVSQYASIVSTEVTESERDISFVEMKILIEDNNIQDLHAAINLVDGLYVHSLARGMKLYKDKGTTEDLEKYHKIDFDKGTHGIGHVRMATESAEDINAAHPFVSPYYPELSIVHNGQLTNYYNIRRFLESKGAIFKTANDSEAASHLIAYAMMKNGGDLQTALNYALEELDGIFCIIAATRSQIGFVKDKMGIKPLLLFEKEGITLFGSEQIEFTSMFPDVYAQEMDPGEVRIWNI